MKAASEARAPLAQRFADEMGQLLGPNFPDALGLAVSGGGDSMAMLHLCAGWARVMGISLKVVTIDHKLRPESADEAAMVAAECADLALSHTTLHWNWDGAGNLQDAARMGRRDLIGRWRGDLRHVLFAHTEDDQAETFLLRLKRGSGVEGLSAMTTCSEVVSHASDPTTGMTARWFILRPLLAASRAELRHYLKVLKVPFADDPGNEDTQYDRVRMRELLDAMELAGIGRARIAETASRLSRSREALARRAIQIASEVCRQQHGSIIFDRERLADVEVDTRLRLLAAALQFVSSAPYRPRLTALEDLLDRALSGGEGTLHGGRVMLSGDDLVVTREAQATGGKVSVLNGTAVWDHRWLISGPDINGLTARMLGQDGLSQIEEPPRGRVQRAMFETTPAVFDGDRLVGSDAVRFGVEHSVVLQPPFGRFPQSLLVH